MKPILSSPHRFFLENAFSSALGGYLPRQRFIAPQQLHKFLNQEFFRRRDCRSLGDDSRGGEKMRPTYAFARHVLPGITLADVAVELAASPDGPQAASSAACDNLLSVSGRLPPEHLKMDALPSAHRSLVPGRPF
jgi:hypothetical protein